MSIIKKISHQEKDNKGKTLFVIDFLINKEKYLWIEEDCSFEPWFLSFNETEDEINNPSEGVYFFLEAIVTLHFPFSLKDKYKNVKNYINSIVDFALKNLNKEKEIKQMLKKLAKIIKKIPFIEKIYLPDFALNNQGNYDPSFMIEELQKENEFYKAYKYINIISDYTSLTAEEFILCEGVITASSNNWLFECMNFFLKYDEKSIVMKETDLNKLLEVIHLDTLNYFLDLKLEKGKLVYVNNEEAGDIQAEDEELLVYFNEQNKALFYLLRNKTSD